MIKKSFRLMLLAAFALSSVMFVACNKYDDDIQRIDDKLASLEQTVASLKAAVDGGAVISSVSNTADGVKFTLSNGQSYTVNHGATGAAGANGENGKDGADGKPGSVVTIGENGNWFIDGVDQNVSAVGASTFVVDCGSYYELNVVEKVDGENSEIVKINLPKTKAITDIQAAKVSSSGRITSSSYSIANIQLYYGTPLAAKVKFNGITYAKGTSLVGVGATLNAIINPQDADASVYSFVLEDSKCNAPYVLGTATPNMSEKPLTRAEKTVNNGVWDLKVDFAEGVEFTDEALAARRGVTYAITTTSHLGKVASGYDVKVTETSIGNLDAIDHFSEIKDNKTRSVDVDTCFKHVLTVREEGGYWVNDYSNYVVDAYYDFADQTKAAAIGAEWNGTILTATKEGSLDIVVNYLLADGQKVEDDSKTVKVTFEYIAPTGDALGTINWEVKADDGKASNGVETDYYLPMAAVKSALVGNSDNAMPAVVINTIKWADGNKLNAVTTKVNGVKYGKDGTTINVSDIATVASTPYTKNSKGAYVVADDINDELYIKVSFNPNTVLVGDYVVALDFYKSGSNNVTVATTANLSVTAPENTIVKNAPYFNGDNAVVYGTANGTQVTADLDDLFTTEGLAYTVTKIKEDADAEEAEYSPWLGANGAITVPVAATGNANYCVGRDCKLKCVK